jgi:3-oxoadipate enol-lactonase
MGSIAASGFPDPYWVIDALRRFGRAVVVDQRWHDSGIASPRFLPEDCAVHPGRFFDGITGGATGVAGATGAGSTHWCCAPRPATFGRAAHERLATGVFAPLLEAFGPQPGPPAAVRVSGVDDTVRDDRLWALGQFRATSSGAMMRALAEITRFDSTRWIADIDMATSVLIPLRGYLASIHSTRHLACIRDGATGEVGAA